MANAHLTPKISIEAAHRWLNIDTYWASPAADPADSGSAATIPSSLGLPKPVRDYPEELKRKYPLVDQSGQPRRSRLHDSSEPDLSKLTIVEQLFEQLDGELNRRNWAEARAKIIQIESICLSLPKNNPDIDPLQIIEARLGFGLAYYKMGESAKALEHFELCAKTFGADIHAEAIARWIAGYVQLETPQLYLNEGLVNWQRSWQIFAQAVSEGNRHPKSQVEWYDRRAKLMLEDLQEALAHGGIQAKQGTDDSPGSTATPRTEPPPQPPTPDADPVPSSPPPRSNGPRPAPKPSMKRAPAAVLSVLPIVHSELHAGAAGVVLDEIEEYATTEEVSLKGVLHVFHRFDGTSAPLELKPGYQYRVMKVEGDSMNQIVAPGEYVVLALPGDVPLEPEPGDIVAVEISVEESDEPDTLATLKEWRPVLGGIELRPRSFNPEHQPQVYLPSSVRARALAIGVLRPRS